MKIIQDNFFSYKFSGKFDGIITDIPYTKAFKNKLHENTFDISEFVKKINEITKKDSFFLSFVNFENMIELYNEFAKYKDWKFQSYVIWDKRPVRNWIAWAKPLRICEFIIIFKKGKYPISFKNGIVKPKVNRSSFGGSLKNTNMNKNEVSEGMYEEIISISGMIKNRKHPTEKPKEFSEIFAKIFGNDAFILDPCCGSGNLISAFHNSLGIDIDKY